MSELKKFKTSNHDECSQKETIAFFSRAKNIGLSAKILYMKCDHQNF